MMKKHLLPIVLSCLCCMAAHAQTELLKNPSFEEEAKPIRNRRFGPNGEGELFGGRLPAGTIPGWIAVDNQEENSKMTICNDNLPDTTQHHALRWEIAKAPATIANVGHHGIEVIEGHKYTLTFWARADKKYRGKIRVGLQSKSSDDVWYAQAKVKGKVKKRWKKYTVTFTATQSDENARFVITASKRGTLYLDEVSLSTL